MSRTSTRHEAIVGILREKPEAVLGLLRAARAKIGSAVSAVGVPADLAPNVEDYRSDALLLLKDANGKPIAVVVVEVQLTRDAEKRFAWPYYQALARRRHRVPSEVLVVAPTVGTAKWATREVRLGARSTFRPIVAGPEELTREFASLAPEFAFLFALAHGPRDPNVVMEVVDALLVLPAAQMKLYFDEILLRLPLEIHKIVKERLMSESEKSPWKSRLFRELVDKGRELGREEGREEGLRTAIRTVLDARGIVLTNRQREMIDACADGQVLEVWARRAAVASTVGDVFDTSV